VTCKRTLNAPGTVGWDENFTNYKLELLMKYSGQRIDSVGVVAATPSRAVGRPGQHGGYSLCGTVVALRSPEPTLQPLHGGEQGRTRPQINSPPGRGQGGSVHGKG